MLNYRVKRLPRVGGLYHFAWWTVCHAGYSNCRVLRVWAWIFFVGTWYCVALFNACCYRLFVAVVCGFGLNDQLITLTTCVFAPHFTCDTCTTRAGDCSYCLLLYYERYGG